MSSTTQILFNSPALHSLKRDQLVKLCKLHSLKANGKNAELIDRLKQKAAELPPDAAELPDDEAEEDADVFSDATGKLPRPSEQWEIVMDDIEEVDETNGTLTSMNTLRTKGSAGEFGTNGTKSSVTSSLKAIASSFGIKRSAVTSKSSVASTSSAPAILSSIPAEPFETSASNPFRKSDSPAPEPIPGNASRPGMPAPANARLSTGTGITTTIRLISTSYGSPMPSPPRLQPYQTTFDIDMGTPGAEPGRSVSVWPASPGTAGRLYPAVPYEDLKPTPITKFMADMASHSNSPSPSKAKATPNRLAALRSTPRSTPVDVPDLFSPSKAPQSAKRPVGRISAAQDQPFLFGSPLPQHKMNNKDFGHAAASVLEEMNQRLAEAGVKKVDEKIISGNRDADSDVFGVVAKPTHKKTDSGDRFMKAHEEAFSKMDSIATHYAAKRVLQAGQVAGTKKRKSEALGQAGSTPAAKRKSNAAARTGTRVISNGVRKNMGIPGGFGDENEEEEEAEEEPGDRRASKRIRVAESAEVHQGRRVSLLPQSEGQTPEEREREEKKREREKEAVKRKLRESRARRSSRGRASVGKAAPPAKPSRFGFLASAKSLVRNVWNMGAGSNIKAASNIPVAKPPPAPVQKAAAASVNSKPMSRVASGSSSLLKPTNASAAKSIQSTASSSHPRPPIPSFNGKSTMGGSTSSQSGQTSAAGTAASHKPHSNVGVSSMGTRKSSTSAPHAQSNVSSMGTRKSVAPSANTAAGSTKTSGVGATTDSTKKRTSSTLMAPTASSLAKRHGMVFSPTEQRRFASPSYSLQPITNSVPASTSPRPTKIFSSPLTGLGSPGASPTSAGAAGQTLTAAATSLMARENARPVNSVALKPKATVSRKPRISRSRVIAKLGAQRAAVPVSAAGPNTSVASGVSGISAKKGPRTRSSIGTTPRRSLGVKHGGRVSGGELLMSAKKKARQTEYLARQRGRIAGSAVGAGVRGGSADVSMNIDE